VSQSPVKMAPHPASHPDGLSMLDKRRIEAEILKEVYETLKASHGEAVARQTVSESVRRSAIEQARTFAASVPGGTSLKSFQDIQHLWTKGGSLEIEVKEQTDTSFTSNSSGHRPSWAAPAIAISNTDTRSSRRKLSS
jgi:hypothetical protein